MIEMEFDQIIKEFEDSSDIDFAQNMRKFGITYLTNTRIP